MTASTTSGPRSSSSKVDTQTLFVTAVASAIAAYACSKLWAPGTLVAAAFTPVVVAILKDVVGRSTDVVTRAVPIRGVVRSAAKPPSDGAGAPTEVQPPPVIPPVVGAPFGDPLAPPIVQPPLVDLASDVGEDPTARVPQPGQVTYHDAGNGRRKGLRVAIITGLLGFLVATVVLTVPELVAGGSASGDGRGTTLFGGGKDRKDDTETKTTQPSEQSPAAPAPQTTVTVPVPAPEDDTTIVPPQTEPVPPAGGDGAPTPEVPDTGGAPAPGPVEPPPG